jgi:hypothetical protein
MLHVKHFCPIGAGNLTRPHTARGLETGGIAQKFGRVGGCMVRPCAVRARIKARRSRVKTIADSQPKTHLSFAPDFCTEKPQYFQSADFRAKFLIFAQNLSPRIWRPIRPISSRASPSNSSSTGEIIFGRGCRTASSLVVRAPRPAGRSSPDGSGRCRSRRRFASKSSGP